jgi:heat shock protein HslJ
VLREFASGEPAPETPEVTLVFQGSRIGGRGGCNQYFANVERGAAPGAVTIGPIGATRMACPEPQMSIESRYLGALAKGRSLSRTGDKLALEYDDGGVARAMTFERMAATR